MHLHVDYPDEVVKAKFLDVCRRVEGLGDTHKNVEAAGAFAIGHRKLRQAYIGLKADGAGDTDMHEFVTSMKLSSHFWFYYNIVRVVVPTSVEAERGFSILSRLRSRFRRGA